MVMHGHESAVLAMKRSQPWVGLGLIDLQHLAMARTAYPPVFFRLSGERSKLSAPGETLPKILSAALRRSALVLGRRINSHGSIDDDVVLYGGLPMARGCPS
jgi:hypothetical protein